MNAKFTQIIEAITADIAAHEHEASNAMLILEQMNTSPVAFDCAYQNFCTNQIIARYLQHIKSAIEKSNAKVAENLIRFHVHYQHKNWINRGGCMEKSSRTSIIMALERYIADFFESPNP